MQIGLGFHFYMLEILVAFALVLPCAVRAEFSDELLARFPAARDAKIQVAWPGFHAVVRGQEVVFVKDDLSILVTGDVVDLNTNTSLTKTLLEANKRPIDVTLFQTEDAISFGSGPAKLYVFSDPDCPYCQQLEHELEGLKGVQVLVFAFPLPGIHPHAASIAESVWCANDRAAAWKDYLLRGIQPKAKNCDNPIARNLELGLKMQVQGTPAIIFEDGTLVPGAIPLARIQSQLQLSNAKLAKAAP